MAVFSRIWDFCRLCGAGALRLARLADRPFSSPATALLSKYDMAVVDEALQLSAEEFGRLHAMYLAAGKRLLLLLMGDDWQLPSINPQSAADRPAALLPLCHSDRSAPLPLPRVRHCSGRGGRPKHDRLRGFVARVARLRAPHQRGGHYGAFRARQVRRPAVCNLLQARTRAWQKRSGARSRARCRSAQNCREQKSTYPRAGAGPLLCAAAVVERRGGGQDCPLRSCSLLARSSASLTLARRASK